MEVEERTVILKPWRVGPYSKAVTVPGWWLRLNDFPQELEVTFKYEPGMDVSSPIPLRSITDRELSIPGVEIRL